MLCTGVQIFPNKALVNVLGPCGAFLGGAPASLVYP